MGTVYIFLVAGLLAASAIVVAGVVLVVRTHDEDQDD